MGSSCEPPPLPLPQCLQASVPGKAHPTLSPAAPLWPREGAQTPQGRVAKPGPAGYTPPSPGLGHSQTDFWGCQVSHTPPPTSGDPPGAPTSDSEPALPSRPGLQRPYQPPPDVSSSLSRGAPQSKSRPTSASAPSTVHTRNVSPQHTHLPLPRSGACRNAFSRRSPILAVQKACN